MSTLHTFAERTAARTGAANTKPNTNRTQTQPAIKTKASECGNGESNGESTKRGRESTANDTHAADLLLFAGHRKSVDSVLGAGLIF